MVYEKFVFDENSPALINNEHCIRRPNDSVNRMPTEEPVNGTQGDYFSKGGRIKKKFGLGWPLTGLLVVGEMAGSGIVALPTAIVRCGFWPGLAILFIMAFMGITAAVLLGKSWVLLLQRFPVYRTHCRRPYPEIAMRAMGVKAKYIVTACVNVSMFGVTVVFLLLCAKNTRDFLHAFFKVDMSECILMLLIALALLPVTFLKSPKDFWPVIVLGMASTVLAYVLIIAGSIADYTDCSPESQMPELKWSNMLLGMGTIRFTYGGHATFPTIQHDMRDPASFDKSSIMAISLITIFNFIMVTTCGLAYGSSLRASVLNSIQSFWIQQATNIMITLHCLFTLCLVVNPFSQTLEDLFHVPKGFGLKRVLLRSLIMLAVVFIAATIPNFGSVINLIGSSTTTCTSAVFPCVFYLYISAADKRSRECKDPKNQTPISFAEMVKRTQTSTLFVLGTIIALPAVRVFTEIYLLIHHIPVTSVIIGLISSCMAIKSLAVTNFHTPCYLRPFSATSEGVLSANANQTIAFVNCCGVYQNISRHTDLSSDICTAPEPTFY